jgi:hypothetical protein
MLDATGVRHFTIVSHPFIMALAVPNGCHIPPAPTRAAGRDGWSGIAWGGRGDAGADGRHRLPRVSGRRRHPPGIAGLSGDRAQEQCAGSLRPSVPPAGWDCGAPALRRLVGPGVGIVELGRPLGQDPK